MLCCAAFAAILPPQQHIPDLNCSAHVKLQHEGYAVQNDRCFVCETIVESAVNSCPSASIENAVRVGSRPGCSINPYDCLACPRDLADPGVHSVFLSPSSTLTFSASCLKVTRDPSVVTTVRVNTFAMPNVTILGQSPETSVLELEFPAQIGPGFHAENVTIVPVPAAGTQSTVPRCLEALTEGEHMLRNVHGPFCKTLVTARPDRPSRLSSAISVDVHGSSAEALIAVSHVRGNIAAECTNSSNMIVVQQLRGDKPPKLQISDCGEVIDLSRMLNVFGRHLETELYNEGRDQYPAPAVTLFIPELAIGAGVLLLITILGHEGDIARLIRTLTGRQDLHPVSERIETTHKEHSD